MACHQTLINEDNNMGDKNITTTPIPFSVLEWIDKLIKDLYNGKILKVEK